MTNVFEQVVLIVAGQADGPAWLGTGTLVAPNRILTAAHVVCDDQGQPLTTLGVIFRGESEPVPALLEWPLDNKSEKKLDVAVLKLLGNAECKPKHSPLLVLSADDIATATDWEAQGYPRVRDEAPSRRLEKVRGQTLSYKKDDSRLDLDLGASPENYKGLSGAPVVVRDRIVGITRAVPMNWGGKRLEATPVGRFFRDPAFRKALGLTDDDERLDKRIQKTVDNLALWLVNQDELISLVTQKLDITYAPGQGAALLAQTLVHQRMASDVVKHLNHLDAELCKKDPSAPLRIALKTLLWQILPVASDWRELVRLGVATSSTRKNVHELPLRSHTIAEIILAGIDERCCNFAIHSKEMPFGATYVPIPTLAKSALLDRDGSRLAQLIVKELAPLVKASTGDVSYDDLRIEVDALLDAAAADAPQDERLAYYMLFRPEELRGKDGKQDLWEVVRNEVGDALPSLRLVRLTGSANAEHVKLARHIEDLCSRK